MDIYDLINDFLEHLEIESGRSKKTIDNYRLYLERFVEISLEILNKDEMGPKDKNTGVGCYFLLQCMKVKSDTLSGV